MDLKQYKAINLFTTMEQQILNKISTTPQRLVSYENGKIYKIVSSKGDKVYIGSTTQKYLSQRFAQHISTYKSYKGQKGRGKLSSFILFDEYGIENCSIELIDYCPCKSKAELERHEFKFINSIPCINKQKKYNELSTALQQLSTALQQLLTTPQQEILVKEKCAGCEIYREPNQFIYNSKVNKTCVICCEKRKKRYCKEPEEPPEPLLNKVSATSQQVSVTSQQEPSLATPQPKFKWVWSKDFKVQRMVRVHEEYSRRCVPSIHKYNFYNALTDIRDRYSPSRDKEFSYLNCDFFHTSVY